MCMIRAAYLTHDSVNIKEMCYYIKLYSNTFTSTNKQISTHGKYMVTLSIRQELKIQTKRVTKTIWSSPSSQTADAEAALLWPTLFTCHDWLLGNHEALLPAEPRPYWAYGWLRETQLKQDQLKQPDGCPSSKPLPTKHMTNRGERERKSVTPESIRNRLPWTSPSNKSQDHKLLQ